MSLTPSSLPFDINTLFDNGMMYVSVNEALVTEASAAVASIINVLAPQWESWSMIRHGETGPDLGMVHRSGGANDLKFFFHYARDLERYLKAADLPLKAISSQLRVIELLYAYINQLTQTIVASIDEEGFLKVPLTENLKRCVRIPQPYTTPTLRGLMYPADTTQTGAKPHIDRSLLSIHLGDKGGDLIALQGPDDTNGRVVSPKKGEALVFFGVKILHVSHGRYEPLWHSSTVADGESREALVHFAHCDTGAPIVNSLEAQKAFWRKYRHHSAVLR